MLDTVCGFGTLAERTSKQPGMPGTQQSNAGQKMLTHFQPDCGRSL